MLDRHVFIIGMPGSGKSSLGRRTAKELGLRFIDSDELIGSTIGGTAADFIERYGEPVFRRAETNALAYLTRLPPAIISTGGGIVMKEENRLIMRSWGGIVFNDRPLADILGDIKLDRRPTLRAGGLEKVEQLYRDRIGIYRSAADYTVTNDSGYHAALYSLMRIIREHFNG